MVVGKECSNKGKDTGATLSTLSTGVLPPPPPSASTHKHTDLAKPTARILAVPLVKHPNVFPLPILGSAHAAGDALIHE